jgi:hypothetical protein
MLRQRILAVRTRFAARVGLCCAAGLFPLCGLLAGCANPGPPRSPSLHLPSPPRDLEVERAGDVVTLQFTAPGNSTDKLPLRVKSVRGTFCRQLGAGTCVTPAGAGGTFALADASGKANTVTWTDRLPPELAAGPRRVLAYRVELFNALGRSAGASDAAYTAAGVQPRPVEHLEAEGSRRGVVLHWRPEAASEGSVVLRRVDLARQTQAAAGASRKSAEAKPSGHPGTLASDAPREAPDGVLWLAADASPAPNAPGDGTLDTSAVQGVAYTYTAARQQTVKLGGRTITLRSGFSSPVTIVLRAVYAPAAPTGLVAAAFTNATSPGMKAAFGVDLIWQPVDDAGVAGYNVYRERLDAKGAAIGARERLTATLTREPGFHDGSAQAAARYRYSVTAVDTSGNESAAVTTVVEPSDAP